MSCDLVTTVEEGAKMVINGAVITHDLLTAVQALQESPSYIAPIDRLIYEMLNDVKPGDEKALDLIKDLNVLRYFFYCISNPQ